MDLYKNIVGVVDTLRVLERAKQSIDLEVDKLNKKDIDIKNTLIDINDKLVSIAKYAEIETTDDRLKDCKESIQRLKAGIDKNLKDKDISLRDTREIMEKNISELEPIRQFLCQNTKKRTCPICFEKEVEVYVTTCGHTFCEECSLHLSDVCFICKTPIPLSNDPICRRLYYSE